ncbi:hypothetical protein NP233_g4530 [Leucocoprinus birnbaumii]|uniref:Uncharacterized protein n=1 Tax=Leucocoprinus birnbaumii TaxID=56174 RepID=A0AAD5YVF2_9AGAR|nr:hypothetical protein NP233_g4530 [Leucocoprinus birnbaumii]
MTEASTSSAPPTTAPPQKSLLSLDNGATKSLKRRINTLSDHEFFAPAASSFQPLPYTPHAHLSDNRIKPFQYSRNQSRSHDPLAVPAGMDPHPSDPNVIFIHPPFTTFPGSDLYTDGLTFQVLAENPEWFLDPKDFIHENNSNPHAIAYPPILEPPRGWCPAKKKDLKERGAEGWIKGEEPRLRCTFCRRQYAGVNAKSMWRRHVFEKHKIAMANRRDGSDRPRGRSSNKENKQTTSRTREDGHDTLLNLKLEIAPGTDPQNISHKSKFRSSTLTGSSIDSSEQLAKGKDTTTTSPATEVAPASNRHSSAGPSTSPPLTPHSSSDAGNLSTESSAGAPPTPPPSNPLVPPSPYDPLLTPSFRHSPPQLPSDHPWRFPSPSHPLHSHTRELSLSMLVRNAASPLVKGSPDLGSSPLVYSSSSNSTMRSSRPATPLSGIRLPLSSSNQARFNKSRLGSSPLANRPEFGRCRNRIEESPLSRELDRPQKRSITELGDDWFSGGSLLPSQLNDPFNSIFSSGGVGRPSPLKRALEAESPVLRNRNSAEARGMGIGLLEPFNLARKAASDDEADLSIADSSSSFGDVEDHDTKKDLDDPGLEQDLQQHSPSEPPAKKRRLSFKD